MGFIILLSLITASIAGSAAFFSIYGLAKIFSGTFWAVVLMGSSLEAGKLIAASFLYRYWKRISMVLKVYLTVAVVVLMLITSMGIFGFLSQSYQTDSLPLKEIQVKIDGLKQEQTQLIARKQTIDASRQLAVTAAVTNKSTYTRVIRSKERLANTYDSEVRTINKRLPEVTAQLQELNQSVLTTQLHTGPITYIAKAFGQDIDDATKWVIFLLMIAFDPLAVALTIGVNIVVRIRNEDKAAAEAERLHQEALAKQEARESEASDREQELKDLRAKIQHDHEIASLLNGTHNNTTPSVVINNPEVVEEVVINNPADMMRDQNDNSEDSQPQEADATIDELRKILNEMSAKKELTEEELHDKKQIELILSRKQILENMRSGSTT